MRNFRRAPHRKERANGFTLASRWRERQAARLRQALMLRMNGSRLSGRGRGGPPR